MNRKYMLTGIVSVATFCFVACNSGSDKGGGVRSSDSSSLSSQGGGGEEGSNPKGIGQYHNVVLTHPLDEKLVAGGQSIYSVKCASCHKLSEEKLVGPGWKGVTDRRQPEWIMNFVTNTDEMIDKDTAAQKLLEVCMVRMPNQNLAEADARSVLEFMRKNDGKN